MTMNRFKPTVSVYCPAKRGWTPLHLHHRETTQTINTPSHSTNKTPAQSLSLLSWNINAFSPRPIARTKCIVDHIFAQSQTPHVICLQEVSLSVRGSLLSDERVRNAFLVSDAEDNVSFEDVPFTTMTLLSRECFYTGMDLQRDNDTGKHERFMLAAVSRLLLPSNYGRDALCVDLVSPTMPSTVLRLLNVHLDSLGDMKHYRAQQMTLLADMLREPGCSGGLIAGDFNAISAADDKLINDNGLVDAWIALRGVAGSAGNTWGAGIHKQDGPKRKRLDKVALMGLTALDMKVIRPGLLQVPIACGRFYKVPWSDHCGLTCNFSL